MATTLPAVGTVVATVTVDGAEQQVVQVSSLPAVTGSVTVSNLPATQAVSGTVAVSNLPATGLTDAQLRAAAVPVSGTFYQATQPVSGTVSVSGTVATSIASQPLPTGAATEATLAALNTKTPALGQAAAAASSPVVLASDQAMLPVNILAQPGVARKVTANVAGGASTNQALTAATRRISMVARGSDLRYVIGTGAQTASTASHLIVQNERLDFAVPASAQIAVLSDTATAGSLEITELL